MIKLTMNDHHVFCLVHSILTAFLIWQIFNLQFETFRTVSRGLRLAASALLFALISGICIVSIDHRHLAADWPQLLVLISLICLVQRLRQLRGSNEVSRLRRL